MTLNVKSASFESYDGNQIIFKSSSKGNEDNDPRAKGLKVISGDGYTDNTGLGIYIAENGGNVDVHQIVSAINIKILVPKNVLISLKSHTQEETDSLKFKNMTNEIEVSADFNPVILDNVTGPMTIRTLYGAIDAKFSAAIKGPVSIASSYGAIDISLPTSAKASVSLSTSYGDILASADLNMEIEKNTADNMISYGKNVNGKINGGGTEFKLTSEYGKIYLRPRK